MRGAPAFLAAVLVTGCGILQPGTPDWVANREPLPACGDGPVEVGTPEAEVAQGCLFDAFRAGRGAEIVTLGEMATGERLVSYVRVHDNGTIEMFLGFGDDSSAPGAWERFRCDEISAVGPNRQAGESLYSLDGCEQLPLP